jgi:hypothetical protein
MRCAGVLIELGQFLDYDNKSGRSNQLTVSNHQAILALGQGWLGGRSISRLSHHQVAEAPPQGWRT